MKQKLVFMNRRMLLPFGLFLIMFVSFPAADDLLYAESHQTVSVQVPRVCERQPLDQIVHVISVLVATLWSAPNKVRNLDLSEVQNEPDIRAWVQSMGLTEKLWLVGKLESQALLGTKVNIIEKRGEWMRVAVPDQPTPKEGYTGWIPKQHIAEQQFSYDACPAITVSAPTAWLYEDTIEAAPFAEISFMTQLPLIGGEGRLVTGYDA
jgi:hypothetical protein